MKEYKINKFGDYFQVSYNDYYIDRKYGTYEQAVSDIYKYYQNTKTYGESKEEKEERLRKEKVENRNKKIDQILG